MGRYDKIRYWNGSSWVQPNQIRVWNGSSWNDYGTNDSSYTNSIYVWNGSSWVRKTLNKQTNYVAQDHYLVYSGGAGCSMGGNYCFYAGTSYEFQVSPSAQGNYMMYEIANATSSPKNYARFGFYLNGNYYVYGKSCYSGTAYEVSTKSTGSLAAGVRYTIKYYCVSKTQYISVYNWSTGNTWTANGGTSRFLMGNCGSTMFAGYSLSGRNLYGTVWYAYIHGFNGSGTAYTSQYYLNNTAGGSSTLVASQGSNVTHYGTVKDPSYTTVSWV